MKKIIQLLSQLTLISLTIFATTACNISNFPRDDSKDGNPEQPTEKNITYYLILIKENKKNISDCQEWISDIEGEIKKGEADEVEAKIEIEQIKAEIYYYQAEINEYQYQILLIKCHNKISNIEKAEAIYYLTEKISNLKQELAIKKNYPDQFNKEYLANITKKIEDTELLVIEIIAIDTKQEKTKKIKGENDHDIDIFY